MQLIDWRSDDASDPARRPLARTGLKYLIAGGSVSAFYLALYALVLALGLQYFVGILVAQSVTVCVAFPVYRYLVFGPGASVLRDFWRFLAVWIGGMLAGFALTPAGVELLGWHPWISQVVAIAIVTSANFVLHRVWTFKGRPTPP